MESSLQEKLAVALERLAQAQRVMLWEASAPLGLSPTQGLILLHLYRREPTVRRVGVLAQTFNLTPATVSDAVRVLVAKGLLERKTGADRRIQELELTPQGLQHVQRLERWDAPLRQALQILTSEQQQSLYSLLLPLLAQLVNAQVITVARMCLLCQYFQADADRYYCNLLHKPLTSSDLQIECPDFSPALARP